LNKEIINVGPEGEVTINELAKNILEELAPDPGQRIKLNPIYLPSRPQEVKYAFSSYQKAKLLLNYEPKTNLAEGLKKMIAWAKEIGYEEPKYLSEIELPSVNIPRTWKEKLI